MEKIQREVTETIKRMEAKTRGEVSRVHLGNGGLRAETDLITFIKNRVVCLKKDASWLSSISIKRKKLN